LEGVQTYLEADKKVILVYPTPDAGWNVPDRFAKLIKYSQPPELLSTSHQQFRTWNNDVIEAFDSINDENLYKVKPHEILCNTYIEDRCINTLGEKFLYYDDDHLSNAGAEIIAPEILRAIEVSILDR